ncbi:hypothetical protein, partial [Tenacibaculum sp.]|uniref:hypothetical protein n=1 Tax=Tenacibaculum sp. TaxID=1906242 RepID=UPI003D135671
TEEFIKEHNLNEEQVKGITDFSQEFIANKQKEWDGKANENAEGIINGVIKATQQKFGVNLDRQQGEKHADYLSRLSEAVLGNKQSELDKLKSDYEEKIKGVKGNEALTAEFEKMKQEKEEILKRYADYDEVKEKASKYEEANQTLSSLKLEVAFNGVKPSFAQDVNPYEAKAKWEEFKKEILGKYTIELVDNEPMAVDKENHYKTVKLKDLVDKDNNIQELLKGRQQGGTGAKAVDLKEVQGVPFKVPANADSKTRSKLITDHLLSKGLSKTSDQWSTEFAYLHKKILQGQTQAA